MTNLQILNDCSCLVQYVHLSCPFVNLTCNVCEFNPFTWPDHFDSCFLSNALNKTRVIPFLIIPSDL